MSCSIVNDNKNELSGIFGDSFTFLITGKTFVMLLVSCIFVLFMFFFFFLQFLCIYITALSFVFLWNSHVCECVSLCLNSAFAYVSYPFFWPLFFFFYLILICFYLTIFIIIFYYSFFKYLFVF